MSVRYSARLVQAGMPMTVNMRLSCFGADLPSYILQISIWFISPTSTIFWGMRLADGRTGRLRASRRAADGLRRILPGKSVTNRPQGAEEPRVRGSNRVSCWVRLQSPASDHELSSGPRRLSTHHRHHRHRSRGRAFLHGQVLQHQGDAILLRHGTRALAKEKGGD